MVTVEDTEILGAIKELAESTGVFAEPAGVTAYAGFCKISKGLLNSSSTVVVVKAMG